MDFKIMASDLGLDEEDFRELAELLVTTSSSDLEKLEKRLAEKNTEQVALAAHSIKGAAGNLGFMDISTIAAQIEKNAREKNLKDIEISIKKIKAGLDAISEALCMK